MIALPQRPPIGDAFCLHRFDPSFSKLAKVSFPLYKVTRNEDGDFVCQCKLFWKMGVRLVISIWPLPSTPMNFISPNLAQSPFLAETTCALQRCSHVLVTKDSLGLVDLNALASTVKEARTFGRPKKPAGGLTNDDLVIPVDATEEVEEVEEAEEVEEEEKSDSEGKSGDEEVRGLGSTPARHFARLPAWDLACPYL